MALFRAAKIFTCTTLVLYCPNAGNIFSEKKKSLNDCLSQKWEAIKSCKLTRGKRSRGSRPPQDDGGDDYDGDDDDGDVLMMTYGLVDLPEGHLPPTCHLSLCSSLLQSNLLLVDAMQDTVTALWIIPMQSNGPRFTSTISQQFRFIKCSLLIYMA